jgi:hypothetical protein
MSDPGRFKKIEKWYNQLRNIAVQKFYPYDPKDGKVKDRLSLPYATKGRREALVSRVAQIFDININEEYYNSKPAYKLVQGFYDDGGIQFPYAFEILVTPYKHPLQHDTIFIGAINYSVSPLNNKFEGYYGKDSENNPVNNISKLLEAYGFYQGFTTPGIRIPKSKLSSVIVANLVTLRRDPQGYDKSRIDILPFAKTIIEAVAKVSSEIKTFQGAHFRFINDEDKNTGKQDGESKDEKVTIRNLLREFLIEKRGLPATKKRRRIQ